MLLIGFLVVKANTLSQEKKAKMTAFSLSNDQFSVDNQSIKIPNLGWVKMTEALRYKGKILSAKVLKHGGKWFVSIAVELSQIENSNPKQACLLVWI